MAAYDDLNNKRIFGVAILSVIVVVATALAVQVLYYWMVRLQHDQTAAQSSYARSNEVLAEQTAEIERYGVDPGTAKLTLPIDQAIQRVVRERSSKEQQTDDEV